MEKWRLLYIHTFLQEIWICNQNLKIPIISIWPFHRIGWPLTPLPAHTNSTNNFVKKTLDSVLKVLSEFLQIWTKHQNHGFPKKSIFSIFSLRRLQKLNWDGLLPGVRERASFDSCLDVSVGTFTFRLALQHFGSCFDLLACARTFWLALGLFGSRFDLALWH